MELPDSASLRMGQGSVKVALVLVGAEPGMLRAAPPAKRALPPTPGAARPTREAGRSPITLAGTPPQ
jgi:hypothetical protein